MQRLTAFTPPRRAALGLAAAGLAVLAAAVPSTASAVAVDLYDVEVDATVQTTYTGDASSTDLEHHSTLNASTHVASKFLASIERAADGRIIGADGEDHHTATTTATVRTEEREYASAWDDWWERSTECTGAGQSKNDTGRTSLWTDPLTPLVGAALTLNLADTLAVGLQCTDTGRNGGAGPRSFVLTSPTGDPFAPGPLAVSFDLPPEATAGGKVIQLFEGPAAGHEAYCPPGLEDQQYMTSCRVRFSGTIAMTKVVLSDGEPQPPKQPPATPPGGPSPIIPIAPPIASSKPSTVVRSAPLVRKAQRVKLDAKASRFSFSAACSGGCTGKATLRVPASKQRKAKLRRLTTVSFRVAKGGAARTVRVTVPKAARASLRDAKSGVVDLSLRDGETGKTTSVRLKLAR